jgi:peptide/nickel transport system permease protein
MVAIWLGCVARGDLSTSISRGCPVSTLIGQRAATTIWLTLFAMLISVGTGVPIGVVAAWRKGSWLDRAVMVFATIEQMRLNQRLCRFRSRRNG